MILYDGWSLFDVVRCDRVPCNDIVWLLISFLIILNLISSINNFYISLAMEAVADILKCIEGGAV